MTNERIINAMELFTQEVKELALHDLKNDPEWMETTLQAENVKVWANNLIQAEVAGIVENADNIQSLEETVKKLEKQIEQMDCEDEINQVDDRVDDVIEALEKQESRINTIEESKSDSVTEQQVAAMMKQAFQGAIDAHFHLTN